MYVYGKPGSVEVGTTYVEKYGLHIYPGYTRATCVQNYTKEGLSQHFLSIFKLIVESKDSAVLVDLEQPYLESHETAGEWYYVPDLGA